MKTSHLLAALCIFALSSCSTSKLKTSKEILNDTVTKNQSAISSVLSKSTTPAEKTLEELFTFPVENNLNVQKWLDYFMQNGRERFQLFLNRGSEYKNVVQTILKENELPSELYYLAMIESGYSTNAYSTARALGVWQFISGTAKRYDLDVNYYVDERRDPIRSTEAAAKYLKDLYRAFQSWHLAVAAYNAGEYRILSSIIKGKTRDFWELSNKRLLPKETRNYVPKLMAAILIGKHPEKYGFKDPVSSNDFPDVVAVEIPSPIKLKDVSKISKIPLKELKRINPHLRKGITPPHMHEYEIWVPINKEALFKNASTQLAKYKIIGAKRKYYSKRTNKNYHLVRKGETLSKIARRYKVSVRHLKTLNNLKSSKILANKRLRLSAKSYHRPKIYKVRRGDNLSKIAKRFKTSVKRLMKLNNLRKSRIYPGMKLNLLYSKRSSKKNNI